MTRWKITPKEWGVLDEVSRNQVAKMTDANYTASVQNSAYLALRRMARDKIVAAVKASDLTETRENGLWTKPHPKYRA